MATVIVTNGKVEEMVAITTDVESAIIARLEIIQLTHRPALCLRKKRSTPQHLVQTKRLLTANAALGRVAEEMDVAEGVLGTITATTDRSIRSKMYLLISRMHLQPKRLKPSHPAKALLSRFNLSMRTK